MHGGVAEDFIIMGYEAASLGKGLYVDFLEEHTVFIFKGLEV